MTKTLGIQCFGSKTGGDNNFYSEKLKRQVRSGSLHDRLWPRPLAFGEPVELSHKRFWPLRPTRLPASWCAEKPSKPGIKDLFVTIFNAYSAIPLCAPACAINRSKKQRTSPTSRFTNRLLFDMEAQEALALNALETLPCDGLMARH